MCIRDRDGTVIAMNKLEVVVNIGYKSDGIIPLNEFRYNPDLKIGDTVEVYIENQEDKKGQLILSHKKARATRSMPAQTFHHKRIVYSHLPGHRQGRIRRRKSGSSHSTGQRKPSPRCV